MVFTTHIIINWVHLILRCVVKCECRYEPQIWLRRIGLEFPESLSQCFPLWEQDQNIDDQTVYESRVLHAVISAILYGQCNASEDTFLGYYIPYWELYATRSGPRVSGFHWQAEALLKVLPYGNSRVRDIPQVSVAINKDQSKSDWMHDRRTATQMDVIRKSTRPIFRPA